MIPKFEKIFSKYFYNKISYLGIAIFSLIFLIEVPLFGIDFFSGNANLYLGLITYLILPPFLLGGLALIFVGYFRTRRLSHKGLVSHEKKSLIIDFSKQHTRNLTAAIVIGGLILISMSTIGAYKAYHYTESVRFCGQTCHNVMKPEYTTYNISPHSRVKCVECHIGGGMDWYLQSKISGSRQLMKLALGNYTRPIPTPVHNLRPAKETCEECHWPGKLFGNVEMVRNYFSSTEDGKLRRWKIRMLMQVSGDGKDNTGIHAHMYINNKVTYVASDDKRQVITWVKSVNKAGEETVYTTSDSPYKDTPPPPEKIRSMDCMDCHSRPAHNFEAPMTLVNRAMQDGKIDMNIPFIKAKAVEVLAKKTYTTEEQAVGEIRESLLKYYEGEQADYYTAHQKEVKDSVEYVTLLYKSNFFPDMKSRWDAYQNNIGHMINVGCYRCHDGEHSTATGKKITNSCESCHTIIGQGPPEKMEENINGLKFRHPYDDDEAWKDMSCIDCHTGS